MSITAIITNHDYAKYLPECLDSASRYCDEILVYDDGSTDESLQVLEAYPSVKVTHRKTASGTPVWGSNKGIKDASCTHTIFLDADNFLIKEPPVTEADYTFAALRIYREDRPKHKMYWTYPDWPLTADECWERFAQGAKRGASVIPFPWGGVWRTDFIKGLKWRPFETTGFAADMRTALDWCKTRPSLAYSPEPFMTFRIHSGQWSESPERATALAEIRRIAKDEGMPND